MSSCSPGSRILVSGAAGFLGGHLVNVISQDFSVRSLDITNCPSAGENICGSVTDASTVARALEDVQGLVIAHMLPNKPGNYESVDRAFDVNVRGAALLLEEAARREVQRVVLISSTAVVQGHLAAGTFLSQELAPQPTSVYGLTKTLQEATARYFHQKHGLEIAVLRPAYVALGDTMEDKYGIRRPSVNWQAIDPRDIGLAVRCALLSPALDFEIFHLVAGPDAEKKTDVERTFSRLGWTPQYRFSQFPRDAVPGAPAKV